MQTLGALLTLLLVLAAARGQDDEQLFMGKTYSVPDSVEVLSLTRDVKDAVAEGRFEKAALILQKLLDYHKDAVVMVGTRADERFVGSRVWLHGYLRSMPEPARRAYESMARPLARDLIERAVRHRDPGMLREAIRRYYLSGEGPAALRAMATLLLTGARFEDVSHHLSRLIEDFPGEVLDRDRAMLAFALAKGGDREGFQRFLKAHPHALESESTVRIGGETVPLGRFLASLMARLDDVPSSPTEAETGWRVFGGSPSRAELPRRLAPIGTGRWNVPTNYRYSRSDHGAGQLRMDGRGIYQRMEAHFPIHPVVDRGIVYYQNGYRLFAVNLYSGKEVWTHDGPITQSDGRANVQSILSPAVADGVLFANLEVPVEMPDPLARSFSGRTVIFYVPQRRLFALDIASRKVLWGHSEPLLRSARDRELLEDINANSPPLPVGDTVYVMASRHANRYFSYVLAVDAKTGAVRWRTLVCTGQQELNLFGRPIKELACGAITERDGVLYCVTNLGVAAALDRRSGEILWIKGYPQMGMHFATVWHTTPERKSTWRNCAPVATEDSVYFTPTDSRELVALDRRTGKLQFLFNGGDAEQDEDGEIYRYFLGAGPRYLYVAGPRVLAIDRRTGKVAWRPSRGAFKGDLRRGYSERALGRGLVTEDAVVTLTGRGLYSFDLETGERKAFVPIVFPDARRGGTYQFGGNLVKAGDVLLIAQRDRIGAFYAWEGVYREFKKRIRKDPENPALAIEAGQVFLQGGGVREAVEAFKHAIAKARRLPHEERRRIEMVARKGLFDIHMLEGEKLWEANALGKAAKSFQAARDAAPDDRSRITALLRLAAYEQRAGSRTRLKALYKSLVDDLGDVPFEFPSLGAVSTGLYTLIHLTDMALDAGRPGEAVGHLSRIIANYPGEAILSATESQMYAKERIDRILAEHGRGPYRPLEERAGKLLETARKRDSEKDFAKVIRLYPNSRSRDDAAVELGELLLRKQDWRQASIVLRRILSEFPDSPKAPVILFLIAEALEKRGYVFSAKSALTRLSRLDSSVRITRNGRTRALRSLALSRLSEPPYRGLVTRSREINPPLELLWTADEGDTSYVRILETSGIVPPGAERILYLGTNGVLRAVDSRTKALLWQRGMNGILTRLLYSGGRLVLLNNRTVSAMEPDKEKVLWEMVNDAQVRAVGATPSTVFLLTAETREPTNLLLRAIGPRSGLVLWERALAGYEAYDLLLVTEEAVGIAARDPAAVAMFDAASGRLRFRVDMAPRSLFREPFLVDGDKLMVMHGSHRFELFDVGTGQRIWETRFPDDAYFRTVMPVAEGIFLTDVNEQLMLLDGVDGSIRWTVPGIEDAPLQHRGDSSDPERIFIVRKRTSDDLHFAEARDLRTGELLWRADLTIAKSADPAPIVTDHHIVYNVNSYDFAKTAWTSATVFIEKETGKVVQVIKPPQLEGLFTLAILQNGVYGLGARGRVSLYGPR